MGPLQRKVLMVLQAASRLDDHPGLTPVEISRVISESWRSRVGWGSVLGAMSGMANAENRHWIFHDPACQESRDPKYRMVWITEEGAAALRLKRRPRRPHPVAIEYGQRRKPRGSLH